MLGTERPLEASDCTKGEYLRGCVVALLTQNECQVIHTLERVSVGVTKGALAGLQRPAGQFFSGGEITFSYK